MRKINRVLWWCAGANIEILEDCKTEHAKFFGIGGTILFTALMASFAGGYAFYTAFKSVLLAVSFGVFWGLLIFNLDRYIVSTIGKGDGTQSITLEEWTMAFPRILMAILLGFVISTPLELRIFEKEIQTVVERLKIEKAEDLISRDKSFNDDYAALGVRMTKVESDLKELTNNKKKLSDNAGAFFEEKITELKSDVDQKSKELRSAQIRVNTAHNSFLQAEEAGIDYYQIDRLRQSRNTAINRRNQLRREKEILDQKVIELIDNQGNAIQEEQKKIDKQIAILVQEKEALLNDQTQKRSMKNARESNVKDKMENYDGFAAHLEAMSILTEEKEAIWYAKWLITLLFIFIELAPVLFKLMSESGPYDDIIERIKYETNIKEKLKISELNDQINTTVKITSSKNKLRYDAELKGNQELLDKIAEAQAEIALKAVEVWKLEELQKLAKNGSQQIVNSNGQAQNVTTA